MFCSYLLTVRNSFFMRLVSFGRKMASKILVLFQAHVFGHVEYITESKYNGRKSQIMMVIFIEVRKNLIANRL